MSANIRSTKQMPNVLRKIKVFSVLKIMLVKMGKLNYYYYKYKNKCKNLS